MEMSQFTVSLLYLALPGIVSYFLLGRLTGIKSTNAVHQIFSVFVLSVLSYCAVAIVDACLGYCETHVFQTEVVDILIGKRQSIDLPILLFAMCSSVLTAYVLAYGQRHNWINRIGQKIRATSRYGDEDVWHYFHNAPDKEKNDGWLFIRDLQINLAYHCYVSTWSDTDKDRELVLSEVTVFTNDTSEYLYKCAHLYLCRAKDQLVIEVPIENASQYPEYQWQDPDRAREG